MNKFRFFLLAFAIALPCVSYGADGLVQFPESPASWSVDVVPYPKAPHAADRPNAPQIKRIDITKVGDISRNVITWVQGKPTERWLYGQYRIMLVTDTFNGAPAFMTGEDIAMGGEYAVGFDASSFSWLDEKLLKDTVSYNGKKCSHYEGTVIVEHAESTPHGVKIIKRPLFCEAWIDQDKLLPVAMFDGTRLGIFTFHDPPTGPLVPPPAIKKAIDHYIAASKPLK